MLFNPGYEFTPRASAGSTSNAANNTEDPNDNSSHHQNRWDADVCDRGNPAAAATSQHGFTQMSSMAEEQWNDTQEEFGHLEWPSPPMDTSTHLSELFDGSGILDNSVEAWPVVNNDNAGGLSGSTCTGSIYRNTPDASSFAGALSPSQRLEDDFFQNVLNRQGGHQQALGPYVDRLLGQIGSLDHRSQSHVGSHTNGLAASYSHDCLALPGQTGVAPQSLDVIRGQQHSATFDVDQIYELGSVSRGGAFVGTDQADFDSPTRVASNPPLAPDVGRSFSDMASQTNTDMSGDTLSCTWEDCSAKFTGKYRKGNLNRHYRHKHRGQIKVYSCGVGDCKKLFLRTDALLKHHRTKHSRLIANLTNSETSSSL